MVSPWFPHGFPMVSLGFPYGFPMDSTILYSTAQGQEAADELQLDGREVSPREDQHFMVKSIGKTSKHHGKTMGKWENHRKTHGTIDRDI